MDTNYDLITLFQNTFISRRPGVANFVDIIKITIMLVKKTYKGSIKVKKNWKKCIKMQSLSAFSDHKMLMLAELKECVM